MGGLAVVKGRMVVNGVRVGLLIHFYLTIALLTILKLTLITFVLIKFNQVLVLVSTSLLRLGLVGWIRIRLLLKMINWLVYFLFLRFSVLLLRRFVVVVLGIVFLGVVSV